LPCMCQGRGVGELASEISASRAECALARFGKTPAESANRSWKAFHTLKRMFRMSSSCTT
jgi:hypothetical protein